MSLSEIDGATKVRKAKIFSPELPGKKDYELEAHFNPTTLKITRKRKWQDGEQFNTQYPTLQWVSTNNDTLSFTLLFDHTEPRELSDMAAIAASLNPVMNLGPRAKMMGLVNEKSVKEQLDVLYALTTPSEMFPKVADGVRPPLATFQWATFSFTGAITGLSVEYVLFDAVGNPKRATAGIEMQGRLNWDGDIKVEKGEHAMSPKKSEKP